MLHRFIHLFLLIQVCLTVGYTQTIQLKGSIFDANTHNPIKDVSIQIKDKKLIGNSNEKGNFSIAIKDLPIRLVFSHMAYEKKEVFIQDANQLTIELTQKVNFLSEATISSESVIKRFNIGKLLWAMDYEFVYDHILLLVSENRVFGDHLLILVNENGDTLSSSIVSNHPQKLTKDCLGNIYLVGKEEVSKLSINETHIRLFQPITLSEYENTIANCIESSEKRLYYKQLYAENYAINYYMYEEKSDKAKLFKTIVDTAGICLYRAEQEHLASITDPFDLFVEQAYAAKVLFKPVNAPLISNNQHLFLFNFPQNQLEQFSLNGGSLKKTPIDFHKNKKWKREIITDEYTYKIYSLYAHSGKYWINEINPQTGKIGSDIPIPEHIYIDNIKVYKETLYFLFRDRTSDESLALYSMKL